MAHLLIRHQVHDYDSWKKRFDDHLGARPAFGSGECRIFVSARNPNDVFLLFAWDDPVRAQLFAQSDELREMLALEAHFDQIDIWVLDGQGSTPG